MATIKFINGMYDPDTGISTVLLQSKYGHFKGFSRLFDEDKDFESHYTGCGYAEIRALIKATDAELKNKKAEYRGFKAAASMLESQVGLSKEVISLKKHLKTREKEIRELKMCKEDLHARLNKQIELKDKYINKKREEKENLATE